MAAARGNTRASAVVSEYEMPDRRRFAVVLPPLLALISVAAAFLWPSGAAPAAAQSAEPAVTCFEISVGWRICVAPAETPGPCATGAAVPDAANNPGLVADCAILLAAMDTLRGTAALNWDADAAISAWDGVTVDGWPPRVTELRLEERALTGTIPAVLGDLSQLRRLHLEYNQLSGAIPPELGDLARLEHLSLFENRLTGAIPPQLGNLAALEHLDAYRNRLAGPIPRQLGDLRQLRRLHLLGNRLSGPIPPELGDLARLEELALGDNQLTGTIPPWLGDLRLLRRLLLGSNRLSGPIPPELGNLARLELLHLRGNRLTGGIPPALGNLARLEGLWLGENLLTGGIPLALGNLARLEGLGLAVNELTGPIPAVLGDLGQLRTLRLAVNELTGPIPAALGDLGQLRTLHLYANELTGPIPAALGDLGQLRELHLYANELTGPIPPELGDLARLEELTLSDNRLTGAIPPGLAELPLTHLYLIRNGWTGCLPRELAQVERNDVAQLALASCPLPSTTLTYGAPVTTGSVTDADDYAFLSDPDELTTLVTTYEGLRDGSTTGLVIHKNDSAGASQADFYDLVEARDIVEWREADDCFVRYPVTEVKDDPAGDPPRKLLAVKVMTYAFTGCSGAIDTTGSRTITWSPANLQSPDMTIPIRHGPWQLRPVGWTGEVERRAPLSTADRERLGNLEESTDPAVVRQHPLWRDPDLPTGWRLERAYTGAESAGGVIAWYEDAEGVWALGIAINQVVVTGQTWFSDTADHTKTIVETRIIDGHPAFVGYGLTDDGLLSPTYVHIYDEVAGVEYVVVGRHPTLRGTNIDGTIAIARSLYR